MSLTFRLPATFVAICICLPLTAFSQTAPPERVSQPGSDTKVFGLQLGSELSLPECKKMKIAKHDFIYSGGDTTWCYQRLDKMAQGPVLNETLEIYFPIQDRPEIASGLSLVASVINGKLEGIGFNTLGVTNENDIFAKLVTKYGKPTSSESTEVQNRFGAKFSSVHATWQFSNLVVEFQGVASSLDSGLVTIDTTISKLAREEALKKLNDGRPL